MAAALLICIIYAAIVWLVFFKFKWLKFSIPWAVVSCWVGLHNYQQSQMGSGTPV